ncbi:MAG: hypothetical protein RBT16_07175 [Desulfococcus multivorans]|jgi:hypothetical protein|nr:hypothetical protein [Desulfococcus multivorans]
MILIEIGTAIIIAAIFYGVFQLMHHRERRRGALSIFLIILFGAWAGGIWLTPLGPSYGSIYLLPFILGGVVVSLIVLAFSRDPQPRNREETLDLLDRIEAERNVEKIAFISMNLYLKCLMNFLILAVVLRYVLA